MTELGQSCSSFTGILSMSQPKSKARPLWQRIPIILQRDVKAQVNFVAQIYRVAA